uniref:Uncharacterized protein n=1 Tax=Aegilops tauschii subsp. strangulata TaxID=200361 RepID=A0A453MQM4_AEGTS
LLSSRTASPLLSLQRLLSTAAAPAVSPNPSFAVEDYLVSTCGLTRAKALKASAKLSHLKSPAKPDAVLAFLAGLGLSGADVAAVVAKDPLFLCAGVEGNLGPAVAGLTGLGLSRSEVARLVSLSPDRFRRKNVVPKAHYYLSLLGSSEDLLLAARRGLFLFSVDLDIPRIVTASPERVLAMVACAEGIGVPRGSGMFRHALQSVACFSEEKIAAKVEQLKKTLRWSDADVGIALCKWPTVLRWSKDMLQRKSEFLISKVGLEPAYIAHRPVMLSLSLEGRLKPRYYVMRFLQENGLLSHGRDYYAMVLVGEKVFVERFIRPHKQAAPLIAEDYAAACIGEVPARFRFT